MPTYDYECTQCGHRFERFQSISDEPEKICPECGGVVRRLIGTGAGIIFKGSGFYTTDYRSKDYKEKAKTDSKSESGPGSESGSGSGSGSGDSSSGSKSESPSKPETKTGSAESSPKTPASPPPAKPPGKSDAT